MKKLFAALLVASLAAGCERSAKTESVNVSPDAGAFLGVPVAYLSPPQSLLHRSTKEVARTLSKLGLVPFETPVRCSRVTDAPHLFFCEAEFDAEGKRQPVSVLFFSDAPMTNKPWVMIATHWGDRLISAPNRANVLHEE